MTSIQPMVEVRTIVGPLLALVSVVLATAGCSEDPEADTTAAGGSLPADGWPAGVVEVRYRSTADDTGQAALFYAPGQDAQTPLLVALHTWSGDYLQQASRPYADWCVEQGWIFIHPDFRGPNTNPDATGSERVVADVLSAVAYARSRAAVDTTRVYLVGASGGGYAALLMAGRAPGMWAGVSAWVPITDLAAWYQECAAAGLKYAEDLAQSCGGPPGSGPAVDRQYRRRSALTHLAAAASVPIDINAGIRDGHDGSVPVSHSLRAFNVLAAPADRITETDIAAFVKEAAVPAHLRQTVLDPAYGQKRPLFRRQSRTVRVTIFDGDHEIVYGAALQWLSRQRKAM